MNKYSNGLICALLMSGISNVVLASNPVFLLTHLVTSPSELVAGQNGTAIYQLFNYSNQNLTNIGFINLQSGVTYVPNAGNQYCDASINLAPGAACLIKFQINRNSIGTVQGGPKVCFTVTKPIYCSQPLSVDQLSTRITPGPISSSCTANYMNFNAELTQQFDAVFVDHYWGPERNQLTLSSSNPDLRGCPTTDLTNLTAINWMQTRVIAAEEFWVAQKLNYCHHYVTDWQTPAVVNGVPRDQLVNTTYTGSPGGQCSAEPDVMPGTAYYGMPVRWNYTGTGSETSTNWLNNNLRWYGIDCSDFTSFVYNMAFGIQFNSDTGYQAGQKDDGSQNTLLPNGQKLVPAGNVLQPFDNTNPKSPAGVLLCKDGSTEHENPTCGGYGTNGYFSAFLYPNASPDPTKPKASTSNITDAMIGYLKPGDLIFLAFDDTKNNGTNPQSIVKHVITWTGKKIGYGANEVNPALIAPQTFPCPANVWKPVIGAWVIIDSTYQGPDYRMFSDCPYRHTIWGVRRVIGYMH